MTFVDEVPHVLASEHVILAQLHNSLDGLVNARILFDRAMLRFVVGDENDEQFGDFRFFCVALRFALQFEKAGNVGLVLLG